MRNRRKDKLSDDNSYEEKRRKRAENSEILRKIAEKFEKGKSTEKANLTETKKEETKNESIASSLNYNTSDTHHNNNSIYARKFEVSEEQKKALEDFFSANNSSKIDYGKNATSRREHVRERIVENKPLKEETVLSNLLLEESEVAIDKDDAKEIGIDAKKLEYGNTIDNIDIEGKPIMTKKEVFENIYDENTEVVHEKKNILYMSLMIIEVLILIIVVSYAIIRVKNPDILKYFSFIPVEKVLLLDAKKQETNVQNTTNSADDGKIKITEGEAKYSISLKIDGKEYKVLNNAKKISESVILLGTRTNIEPEKQHLVIASQNIEGRLTNLEKLKKGDKIVLVVNGKEYNYEISTVKKVDAADVEKTEDKKKQELTIITDAEEGKRVIVYAK